MGKRLNAVAVTSALVVGGFTIAAVNPLGVAGAGTSAPSQADPAPAAGQDGHRDGPLRRALEELVADGTLTQAQADKVIEATKAEAKAGHDEHRAERKDRRQELLAVVAEAIGSTPEDVAAAQRDGTSVAQQAKARGVDRQAVTDALAQALAARIDAAVADGELTADRAEQAKARVDEVVERILDATGDRHGPGHDRGRGRGHGRGPRRGS